MYIEVLRATMSGIIYNHDVHDESMRSMTQQCDETVRSEHSCLFGYRRRLLQEVENCEFKRHLEEE